MDFWRSWEVKLCVGRDREKRREIKNKDNPKPLADQPRRADIDSPSASAAVAAQNLSVDSAEMPMGLKATDPPAAPLLHTENLPLTRAPDLL